METIHAHQIPCTVPVINIHFELTNAAGEYELDVEVENEQSEQPFFTIVPKRKVLLQSPLQVYAIDAAVRGLTFNAPGKYWFKVRANGALITQRSLEVRLVTARTSAIPPRAGVDDEGSPAPEVPPDAPSSQSPPR